MRRLDHGPALLLCFAQPLDSPASDLAPLMIAQARLLAVFLLGFSGEPGLIRRALVGCGYISADFRLRRSVVRPRDRGQCPTEWRQWAAHESMKRYMCTCIILGNLLNIAYGINPGFSVLDECDVEIPDDDELWDATTSSQWESLTHSKPRPPLVSLGKAASMFFTDSDRVENLPRDGWSWSPFATSAVIHQVAIAVWYLTQGQQACNNVTQDTRERSRPESIRIEAALSQCRELLIRRSGGNDKAWNEEDSPLLFNACAILRVSYGRAFMIVRFLDRSLLIKDNSQDKLAILQRYHAASQKRGQFITLAVNRALEGFAIPIRAGIFLIQKTAAFKWSVEHALAAWDAALLVTKWVHAIETLQESGQATALEEKQVLQNVRHLLSEVESEHARAHSLAAALARVWANLYDDTWVWGVAPSIGWALRQLAIMYERDKAVL
uniref:Xylanolytic transcriptional activator regulatory domain-containing protein n=2 Tax=Bionectria ochroleuca TaxID=29856 RepID=A0A0B7K3E6_BIOOC